VKEPSQADTFEAALLQAPEKHWFLKRPFGRKCCPWPGLGLIFAILVRHANDTFLGAAVFSVSEDFGEKLAGNVTWKPFFFGFDQSNHFGRVLLIQ